MCTISKAVHVFYDAQSNGTVSAYVLWIVRPRKYRYSRWNFTNMLQVLLFPVLGAILDSRMSVHDNTSAYPGYNYKQNKYMILKPTFS